MLPGTQILEQRQSKELADLDSDFESQKQTAINQALQELQVKHESNREQLLTEHDSQLQELLSEAAFLSESALEQKRLELLNKQQMDLSKLDQRFAGERRLLEESAGTDLGARHARAKLELREKHYQVCVLGDLCNR